MKITNELSSFHLILEKEQAESTGGRRAGLLEINPEGGFAVGVLPHPDNSVLVVILNLQNTIISSRQWSIPLLREDPFQALDRIVECIEQQYQECAIPKEKILGIGCGVPGLVQAERGYCIESTMLNWHQVHVRQVLEERLGIPVSVDNVMNCLAIYEKIIGQCRAYHSFLAASVGLGVGLGIIADGQIYRGAFGRAGELGHTTVAMRGRPCTCGKQGCLEAYVSDTGIVTNYLELVRATTYSLDEGVQQTTITEVIERAQRGDEAARMAFQRAGTLLGVSLANLVNLFNPECLVISGPETHSSLAAGDLFLEPLHQAFQEHVLEQMGGEVALLIEPMSYDHWAWGAGNLVLNQFFAPPVSVHPARISGSQM